MFVMKFTFKEDDEPLSLRKIPKQNVIEAKVGGQKLLYERTPEGPKKLNDITHPREDVIIEAIVQFFMGTSRNRHKDAWLNTSGDKS